MSINELPKIINPEELCLAAPPEGTKLYGQLPLGEIPNLPKELKAQHETPVTLSLVFSIDNGGLCCIAGELAVDLELICQRCLKPMIYPLRSKILVSPVSNDKQAEALPERYEPLMAPQGEITLVEWIAEELHLALPLAALHDPSCMDYGPKDESVGSGSSSSENPFAKLKKN